VTEDEREGQNREDAWEVRKTYNILIGNSEEK
jgi:hypothetical protein